MADCWNCDAQLEVKVTVVGDITWTTSSCPACGVGFTMADAGELDLGLLRNTDDRVIPAYGAKKVYDPELEDWVEP